MYDSSAPAPQPMLATGSRNHAERLHDGKDDIRASTRNSPTIKFPTAASHRLRTESTRHSRFPDKAYEIWGCARLTTQLARSQHFWHSQFHRREQVCIHLQIQRQAVIQELMLDRLREIMSIAMREHIEGSEVVDNGLIRRTTVENGITRRTTAEALELITRSETQTLSHSAWYEPGRDFW
jgi:hypothetical protein